jgi:ABC-2 type transport system ATP-binding protein
MNAIEARQLTRTFGTVHAVDAVTFDVAPGTVFGLLGPNGAGKSTLLKLLVGHLRPTSGTASVLDVPLAARDRSLWQRIGYVAQSRYLPEWMTGAECLRFSRAFRPRWDEARVARLTGRLDVPLQTKVRDLSRGHYVRLQIALAMAYRPELLLLDEPTSGLDPAGRHELLTILIEEIGQGACTVVFSSHLVEDIERMADTVAIMDAGKILACGPVDEIKTPASSLEDTFLEYVSRRPQ